MIEQAIAHAVERALTPALARAEDRIVAKVLAEMARRWPEPDGWLTRRALADQLQISRDTLDRRIAVKDSAIEVQRIGRAVRVKLRPAVTAAEISAMAAEAIR